MAEFEASSRWRCSSGWRTSRASAGWLDEVDLIAGTSTGGLLALGLARGLDLDTIEDLYLTKGDEIFDDSWLDNVVDLGKVIGADYDLKGLRRELKRVLGDTTTLGDLRGGC